MPTPTRAVAAARGRESRVEAHRCTTRPGSRTTLGPKQHEAIVYIIP